MSANKGFALGFNCVNYGIREDQNGMLIWIKINLITIIIP